MHPQADDKSDERWASRMAAAIDDAIDRLAAGEPVADDEVIAQHPELMPELGERLRDVRRLAQAAARADHPTLDETPTESGADAPPLRAPVLSGVPGYRVVKEISRGGQGIVYRAVQEGTKRKVAIKVLLEGAYASASARRRFEREIELVGQLRHPNIVPVFHSGSTDDGRPFCAMDYVSGLPLQRYARERKLSLRATLELFRTVCEAVQYAHQKGVIHRDLKPSNVLVDAEGVPRVLDFGLAKQLAASADSALTATEQIVGTLPYMAPEQAQGRNEAVDTRTDVYALGVMLYELLTGQYPYPVTGPMADVLRHISETEPTPPSRAWTAKSGVPATSSGRRAGPARESAPVLRRESRLAGPVTSRSNRWRRRTSLCPIDGEVQTIVLKALSKDRERRYESAGALARDIGRYLAGEALKAKRDSALYVLRKALRRYRLPLGVAMGFVGLLAVAAAALWSMYEGQRFQRQRAEQALGREAEQRRLAEKQKETTQQVAEFQGKMLSEIEIEAMGRGLVQRLRERINAGLGRHALGDGSSGRTRTAEEIESALVVYDEMVSSINPTDAAWELLDEHVLQRAARRLESDFPDQPAIRAAIRLELGKIYRKFGLYDAAEPHLRAALDVREREFGREHTDVADSLNQLALLFENQDRHVEAEPLFREALAIYRRRLGSEHPEVAKVLDGMAGVLQTKKKLRDAEVLAREALAIKRKMPPDNPGSLAIGLNNLAYILIDLQQYAEAEQLSHEVLDVHRQRLGDEHPAIAASVVHHK